MAADRYKLRHLYYDIYKWKIYDLDTDLHEMRNTEIRDEFHLRLDKLREKYGETDEAFRLLPVG